MQCRRLTLRSDDVVSPPSATSYLKSRVQSSLEAKSKPVSLVRQHLSSVHTLLNHRITSPLLPSSRSEHRSAWRPMCVTSSTAAGRHNIRQPILIDFLAVCYSSIDDSPHGSLERCLFQLNINLPQKCLLPISFHNRKLNDLTYGLPHLHQG